MGWIATFLAATYTYCHCCICCFYDEILLLLHYDYYYCYDHYHHNNYYYNNNYYCYCYCYCYYYCYYSYQLFTVVTVHMQLLQLFACASVQASPERAARLHLYGGTMQDLEESQSNQLVEGILSGVTSFRKFHQHGSQQTCCCEDFSRFRSCSTPPACFRGFEGGFLA